MLKKHAEAKKQVVARKRNNFINYKIGGLYIVQPFFCAYFWKMMRWSTSILLLFLLLILFSFKNHTTRPYGTVRLTEMNVVYEHIDNPIEIITPGYSNDQISISVEGAHIFTQSPHKYILKPIKGQRQCTIKLSAKEDGKLRLIGAESFRIRQLPTPIPQLGGIPNNGLAQSKAAVVAQTTLISTYGPGFGYNLQNRVKGYKAKVITADSVYSFENDAAVLKSDMREVIKVTQPGDVILFYEIESETYLSKDTLRINSPSIVIPIR